MSATGARVAEVLHFTTIYLYGFRAGDLSR
jgi:hypothetical protein